MNAPKPLTTDFLRSVTVDRQRRFSDGPHRNGLAVLVRPKGYGGEGCRVYLIQEIRINGRKCSIGLGTFPEVTLREGRTRAAENAAAIHRGKPPVHGIRTTTHAVRSHGPLPKGREAPSPSDRRRSGPSKHSPRVEVRREPGQENGAHRERLAGEHESVRVPHHRRSLPRRNHERRHPRGPGNSRSTIQQLWHTMPGRARTLAQRMTKVYQWAVTRNHAARNVAMDVFAGLPKHTAATKHQPAVPYDEVPRVLRELRGLAPKWSGFASALELVVLTGLRTSSVEEAKWPEFDMDARVWTVPAERMKGRHAKAFRVPLTDAVMDCLRRIKAQGGWCGFLFSSLSGNGKMREGAMRDVLAMVEAHDEHGERATVHGFRSSFRDWASERDESRELSEMCLAHNVRGDVERAYSRSDLLTRRAALMSKWGEHCAG